MDALNTSSTPAAAAALRRSGRSRPTRNAQNDYFDSDLLMHVLAVDDPKAFAEEMEQEEKEQQALTIHRKKSPSPKTPPAKGPSAAAAATPAPAPTQPQPQPVLLVLPTPPPPPPAAAAAFAAPAATNKATAVRAAPVSAVPAPAYTTTQIDYTEEDDTPLGTEFQVAPVPAWRPRPAQPTASEAKLLPAAPLYPPTPDPTPEAEVMGVAVRHAIAAVFRADYAAAPDAEARRAVLDNMIAVLDKSMGPQITKVLQLDLLGAKCRSVWKPHEELLFCLGMCDKYRMFKYIRQCYLFNRSAHELNGYYHNVWKTRSTPEAEAYLTLREQRASSDAMYAFVDHVRDRLTAMWDRKTMGDMPKIVRDAAEALGPHTHAQGGGAYCSEDLDTTSGAAAGDSGSEGTSRGRAAASQPRQRKRSATGQQQPASNGKRCAQTAKPEQQQQQQRSLWQQQQQQQQQQQPGGWFGSQPVLQQEQQQQLLLPLSPEQAAATHISARLRSQHQQQQQQAWGPATPAAAAPTPAAALLPLFGAPGAELELPEMPTHPFPDPADELGVIGWFAGLAGYKRDMEQYMNTVSFNTDTAVTRYQRAIADLQERRNSLQADADGYIRALLLQGQQVLHTIRESQAGEQVQTQPFMQQQQYMQSAAYSLLQPAAAAGPPDNLQHAVQQLLLSHSRREKILQQQLQQQVQSLQVMPSPPQQQQQQPRTTQALPFFMGPLRHSST